MFNKIEASSASLAQYAVELNGFIGRVSAKIADLAQYHKKMGNSWQDRLYDEFGAEMDKIKDIMIRELTTLEELKRKIVSKAQTLAEIEKTNFGGG